MISFFQDNKELLEEVASEEKTLSIYKLIMDVANGQLTKAELGGHHEFNLSRLYGSTL